MVMQQDALLSEADLQILSKDIPPPSFRPSYHPKMEPDLDGKLKNIRALEVQIFLIAAPATKITQNFRI